MTDLLGPASAPNATTQRPSDARVFGTDDSYFKGCSAPDVDDGTEIQADWLNGILVQLRRAIVGMGVTVNNADDDMLLKAIQSNGLRGATDTGSANAMVVANTPAITAYTDWFVMLVKAGNDVTDACTINVDEIGAKNVKHPDGRALGAGDWPAGKVGFIVYIGGEFQLLNPRASSSSGAGATAVKLTASLSTVGTSVTFTADQIGVVTSVGQGYLLTSFDKTLNVAVTGAGGMDTGAAPESAFVSIYAIYNPSTGTAALLGTTASQTMAYGGANMPAGYTASCLLAIWPTNSSSQLVAGFQVDRHFSVSSSINILSNGHATSPTSLSVPSIPLAARTVSLVVACNDTSVSVSSGSQVGSTSGVVSSSNVFIVSAAGASNQAYTSVTVPIVEAQKIYYRSGRSSVITSVVVVGYGI